MKVLVHTSRGAAVAEAPRVGGGLPDTLVVYVAGPAQPIEEDSSPFPPGARAEVFALSPSEVEYGVEGVYRPATGIAPSEAQAQGQVVQW